MTERDRRVIAIGVAVVLLGAAWFLIIQPKRSQASKLSHQIAVAESAYNNDKGQVLGEVADEKAYAQNDALVTRLGKAVPADDDSPSLIYQLQNAAKKAGIDFRSLVFTPGAGTAATGAALPPGVVVGPAGFPVQPFTFMFTGSYFKLADFIGRVQHFVVVTNKKINVTGRLMTLNAISLAPAPTGFPSITATISATTYLEGSGTTSSSGTTSATTPATPTTSTTATTPSTATTPTTSTTP